MSDEDYFDDFDDFEDETELSPHELKKLAAERRRSIREKIELRQIARDLDLYGDDFNEAFDDYY